MLAGGFSSVDSFSLTERDSMAFEASSASAFPSVASAPANTLVISSCPATKAALNSAANSGLPNLIANVFKYKA